MKKNDKLTELTVQLVLLFTGAIIAIVSSRLTHYWDNLDEKIEIKNLIIGCIQDDINRLEKQIDSFQVYIDNPEKRIDANSFLWQHESDFFENIALKSGVFDINSIKNINNYINMIHQCRAGRRIVHDALINKNNDSRNIKFELTAYLSMINSQIKIGRRLIEGLNIN